MEIPTRWNNEVKDIQQTEKTIANKPKKFPFTRYLAELLPIYWNQNLISTNPVLRQVSKIHLIHTTADFA